MSLVINQKTPVNEKNDIFSPKSLNCVGYSGKSPTGDQSDESNPSFSWKTENLIVPIDRVLLLNRFIHTMSVNSLKSVISLEQFYTHW